MGHDTREKDHNDHADQRRKWWVTDLILLTLGVVLSILASHLGVIPYISGRRNEPGLMYGYCPLLWFAALGFWVTIAVRVFITWPKHLRNRKSLSWACPPVIICLLSLGLPFTGLVPAGYGGFIGGFKRRMELHADTASIQAWLGKLDPNDCGGILYPREGRYVYDTGSSVALPESITCLCPQVLSLGLDSANRPLIRLSWCFGPIASWGVVVGDKRMPTPPSDLSLYGEYRTELCPGAYVWHDVQ